MSVHRTDDGLVQREVERRYSAMWAEYVNAAVAAGGHDAEETVGMFGQLAAAHADLLRAWRDALPVTQAPAPPWRLWCDPPEGGWREGWLLMVREGGQVVAAGYLRFDVLCGPRILFATDSMAPSFRAEVARLDPATGAFLPFDAPGGERCSIADHHALWGRIDETVGLRLELAKAQHALEETRRDLDEANALLAGEQ